MLKLCSLAGVSEYVYNYKIVDKNVVNGSSQEGIVWLMGLVKVGMEEAYSESCQTSKMEHSAKIINDF